MQCRILLAQMAIFLAHLALTFHGSRGNSTDRVRRAVSIPWAPADCQLDRSKLVDYDHPYLLTGLRHGERLVNRYVPQVYQT